MTYPWMGLPLNRSLRGSNFNLYIAALDELIPNQGWAHPLLLIEQVMLDYGGGALLYYVSAQLSVISVVFPAPQATL